MKKSPSFAESLGQAIALKIISVAIIIGAGLAMIGLFSVADKTKVEAFRIVGALIFLVGFLIALFPAKEIFTRMMEDRSLSFSLAVTHTWYRYLLCLAFIPMIGPVLQRFLEARKKRNPFLSDEK